MRNPKKKVVYVRLDFKIKHILSDVSKTKFGHKHALPNALRIVLMQREFSLLSHSVSHLIYQFTCIYADTYFER